MTEWIDAHVHVWTRESGEYPRGIGYPGTAGLTAARPRVEPDVFSPHVLFQHARPSGVSRIVLIQAGFYGADNSYMLDAIKDHSDVFRGVAWVDESSDGVDDRMTELLARGVTGFRIVASSGTEGRWLQSDGFERMWRRAAETGQAICPLLDPNALQELDRMCARFPDTTVVIDHMARIGADGTIREGDVEALCALARHPRVHVKLSAFYAFGNKTAPYTDLVPMIRRIFDAFGPDRLMWATDCPYQVQRDAYEDSIGLVRDRLDFLSDSDRAQVLRTTAERVFFFR